MAGNTPLGNMIVDVDLNTTKLKGSVTGLQRQMRTVNSALRANLSGLKDSGSESDKLGTKIDGLTKKQKIQEAIVEETEKNYRELVKTKGETAKETEAYANTLNKEQAKLRDVTAELAEMERQHKVMTSPWTKLSEGLDNYGSKLTSIGDSMKSIGKTGMMYVTAPVVAGFTASTKAAIDFETAFAGVRKTVDASESEYAALSDGIRDMSKVLPVSANDIAAVAESAGQLGIKKENILDFSRTIIDLGEATNMTTEQAATEFARFANIMGMSQDEFSNLGSSVVELGNNMATTESEIVAMGMRLGAIGNQVGLSEAEVMALAATMSSLGIESEAGGTAMTMAMKKMQNAVSDGGAELEGFAQVAGMSSTEFAEAFNNDPMTALIAFIQGLEESGNSGENLNSILSNLGITGIRESDTLLRLAGNSELLSDAVGMSSDAWKENTALSEEAAERYETMASQLSILRNYIVDLGIDIGEILLPYLAQFVDFATNLMEKISGMSDRTKLLGVTFAGLAAAIPPVLFGAGVFISLIGSTMKTLAPLSATIAQNGGLLKTLGMAFRGLTGPVGIAVTVIGLLITAFTVAYTNSETFRNGIQSVGDKVRDVWEYIKEFGSGVKSLFTGSEENGKKILSAIGVTDDNISRITGLRDNILEVKDRVLELGSSIADRVRPALQGVMDFIGEVGTSLTSMWEDNSANIIPIVTNIGNGISNVFKGILATIEFIMPAVEFVIKMVWENIQGVIRGGLKVIDGLVKVFSGIFTGDFSKMWEGVKSIFTGAIQAVWNGFQLLFYGRIIKGVGSLVKLFTGSIRGLWTSVTGFFTRLFQDATRIVGQLNTRINNIVSRLVSSLINFFRRMFNNTIDTVRRLGSRAYELFRNMGTRVTSTVGNLFRSVRNFFTNMRSNVTSITTRLRDTAVNLFNALRTRVTNTVRNLYNSVRNLFSNLLRNVRSTVTNLRDRVVNLFTNMRTRVVSGVQNLRDRVSNLFGRIRDRATDIFDKMVDGAKKLPRRLGNAIKNGASKAVDGIKSLGNSMARQLEKVVNGVIKGLNSITSKIGITATISDISIPRFSRGTTGLVSNGAIAKDTLATVGDKGIGNGSGTRELVQYPNGTAGLYDNDATIFAPKGTIIWNNKQTEEILAKNPQFSTGTVGGSGTTKKPKKEKKKGLLGNFKDVLANTWDYIKNPKKALDAVIDNVAPDFSGLKGFAGTMVKGSFNFFKDKALDWITGIFKDNEGGNVDGSSILSKPIYQRFGRYTGNIGFNGGKHYGVDTGHKFDPVMSPTSGKVTRRWWDYGGGNSLQITSDKYIWWFMHLSKILKDVGDAVNVGDKIAVSGSSGNFVVGTGHLHTQVHPKSKGAGNHNAIDPMPLLKGKMATGGFATNGIYHLGEEGYGEWVIPTDPKRRTDAMKLLAHAGKSLQKNNGTLRPNNLPNINTGNEVSELKELISKQQEQLDQNNTMIELLAKIAEKEYVALYDKKKMAKDLAPEMSKRTEYNNNRQARFS